MEGATDFRALRLFTEMHDTSEWKLQPEKVTPDSVQYSPSEFPGV